MLFSYKAKISYLQAFRYFLSYIYTAPVVDDHVEHGLYFK